MSFKLYHYVHCPFCVRVRMALGYLNLSYDSHVLPYDDEITPIKISGKKMLPILTNEAVAINESLDIIAFIDKTNKLKVNEITKAQDFEDFEKLLIKIGDPIHSLAMPYWMLTPEFSDSSRKYFQAKKEIKRGPFSELVKNKDKIIDELSPDLKNIEADLNPFYKSHSFGLLDILLASHLWGLYIVPEFQFSEKMHQYLQSIKQQSQFNYHQDFWR